MALALEMKEVSTQKGKLADLNLGFFGGKENIS